MLKSMSISAKLYLAMLIAVALSLGMAATAYDQLTKVSVRMDSLTSDLYEDLILVQDLRGDLLELSLRSQLLDVNGSAVDNETREQILTLADQISLSLRTLESRPWMREADWGVRAAVSALGDYLHDTTEAELGEISASRIDDAVENMRSMSGAIATRILNERLALLKQLEYTRNLIIIGSVASFLFFALLAAYLVRNHVVAPVSELSRLLQDVASNLDFTRRHNHDMDDEIGSASTAFNRLMDETRTALRELSGNTTQVAGGASQASSAIGQVAEGAQVQIDDLNQIADAMQQTSQSITKAAMTTREASQQAAAAARLVEDGHQRMATMMQAVRGIKEDSKRINRISDAITRIASETHMLSLNASIEAARAGDHGKGFAVVAEQVGQLAEDAAQSAQEIQSLVKQVEADATRSLSTAERFEEAMNEISHRVSESDAMVRSVAAAVEQQRASVARIEVNVGSLREIGQGNATAAEEITATMIELSKLAQRSREQVDRFKTE
ncbi:MAG: hypothetical protein CMM46_00325 [Rhodospirillaceae bacterium]|nr:hypothetical protein [Rhodospirillaceae bacterium]|tara:strand:- start:35579 stop:37081 length:1503 start_codon:yes stop_codon:yes gene_type:complete